MKFAYKLWCDPFLLDDVVGETHSVDDNTKDFTLFHTAKNKKCPPLETIICPTTPRTLAKTIKATQVKVLKKSYTKSREFCRKMSVSKIYVSEMPFACNDPICQAHEAACNQSCRITEWDSHPVDLLL